MKSIPPFQSELKQFYLVLVIAMTIISSCTKEPHHKKKVIETDTVPEVTSIVPTSGKPGSLVTINGSKFGDDPADIIVTFNGAIAPVDSVFENRLVVEVPDDAGTGPVIVTVNDVPAIYHPAFVYIPKAPPFNGPIVTSISADTGVYMDTISIYGSRFGADVALVEVFFGDSVATVLELVSVNRIIVEVPESDYIGTVPVSVYVNSKIANSFPDFTYVNMSCEDASDLSINNLTVTNYSTDLGTIDYYFDITNNGLNPLDLSCLYLYSRVSPNDVIYDTDDTEAGEEQLAVFDYSRNNTLFPGQTITFYFTTEALDAFLYIEIETYDYQQNACSLLPEHTAIVQVD